MKARASSLKVKKNLELETAVDYFQRALSSNPYVLLMAKKLAHATINTNPFDDLSLVRLQFEVFIARFKIKSYQILDNYLEEDPSDSAVSLKDKLIQYKSAVQKLADQLGVRLNSLLKEFDTITQPHGDRLAALITEAQREVTESFPAFYRQFEKVRQKNDYRIQYQQVILDAVSRELILNIDTVDNNPVKKELYKHWLGETHEDTNESVLTLLMKHTQEEQLNLVRLFFEVDLKLVQLLSTFDNYGYSPLGIVASGANQVLKHYIARIWSKNDSVILASSGVPRSALDASDYKGIIGPPSSSHRLGMKVYEVLDRYSAAVEVNKTKKGSFLFFRKTRGYWPVQDFDSYEKGCDVLHQVYTTMVASPFGVLEYFKGCVESDEAFVDGARVPEKIRQQLKPLVKDLLKSVQLRKRKLLERFMAFADFLEREAKSFNTSGTAAAAASSAFLPPTPPLPGSGSAAPAKPHNVSPTVGFSKE